MIGVFNLMQSMKAFLSGKSIFGTAPRKVGANEYWDDKAVPVKNGGLVYND